MWDFWRTKKGLSRVRLAVSRCSHLVAEDIRGSLISCASSISRMVGFHSSIKALAQRFGVISVQKPTLAISLAQKEISQESSFSRQLASIIYPVIFVSACMDEKNPGAWKYNGGIKELNYFVKLLRHYGYEAYVVTYDGTYEPWLVEHQPHISLQEFRAKLKSVKNIRCVTSWAIAEAFINECQELYFWDMELAWTEHSHFSILARLYRCKIKGVAAISRTIQAWHMAHFEKPCTIIPNLLDKSLWFPVAAQRYHWRVGYMDEGAHTEEYVTIVRNVAQSSGIDLEIWLIKGCEADILSGMRSCEVFLSMNIGKASLWGEGCPRTIIEALSTGCVVLAFDIIGNREIIQSNFNGILIPRYRPELMANTLITLYKNPGEIERLRNNALSLIDACHTFDARWPAVREFLKLEDT